MKVALARWVSERPQEWSTSSWERGVRGEERGEHLLLQPAPRDEGQAGVDAVVGAVLGELDHGVVEPVQAHLQGGKVEA